MPKLTTSLREELAALTGFKAARRAPVNGGVKAPKGGLRTAQIRILQALAGAAAPISKARICEIVAPSFPTARLHQAWMTYPLGSIDATARAVAAQKCGYQSLIDLGFVSMSNLDIDGKKELVFEVTQSGLTALDNLS